MKTITLKEVIRTEDKKYKNGNKALRMRFLAQDENEVDMQVALTLNLEQAKELKDYAGIEYLEHEDSFMQDRPIVVEFDETERTRPSDLYPKGQLCWEHKTGSYLGNAYDYYEMKQNILIKNGIINGTKISKNQSSLF